MKRFAYLLLFLITFAKPFAYAGLPQNAAVALQYIENFKDDAIKEMLIYNIPASITLAQGMLESGFGMSDLAKKANNHFGIKCHDEWSGPTYIQDDDAKNECFRKYATVLDSYTDHSLFLKSRARYSQLFELNHTDYRGWAKGLRETGYATDPKYEKRLLELIETYELYKYDVATPSSKIKKEVARQQKHNKKEAEKKLQAQQTATKVIAPTQQSSTTITITAEKHEILRDGIVKYIIIKPKDTFTKISKETDKDLWQLYKYNDMTIDDKLIPGQRLYLQPKHNKGKISVYTAKKGDTMKSISQQNCVKLKKLYKRNGMLPGQEPTPGQELFLRKKKH